MVLIQEVHDRYASANCEDTQALGVQILQTGGQQLLSFEHLSNENLPRSNERLVTLLVWK